MTWMAGEKLVVQKRRRTFYSALHDYSMIPVAIVSINLITKYLDVLNWSISRLTRSNKLKLNLHLNYLQGILLCGQYIKFSG